MNEKNSTYRVEIKNSGTTRNEAYICKSIGTRMSYPSYDPNKSLALAWRD